jgi:phosphate transport system ATP-binding protein
MMPEESPIEGLIVDTTGSVPIVRPESEDEAKRDESGEGGDGDHPAVRPGADDTAVAQPISWQGSRPQRTEEVLRAAAADAASVTPPAREQTVIGPVAVPPPMPSPRAAPAAARQAASLKAVGIAAWFGDHKVLEDIHLTMPAQSITALIGPSGCGKSTFIRILNRMHELIPGAALAGRVELNGVDIYGREVQATSTRGAIGMVFQKPNPFPAMTIKDNVLSGLRLTRTKVPNKNDLVEDCLQRAGLWNEVKNRLGALGGSLSGGQQQRLCIARSLAVRPQVLLMDEPCSALDPASTRRIEQTIVEVASDVTIVIVTHNMQQAQRVSQQCAFFLAEENQPGYIVEIAPTTKIFEDPEDPRTADYVHGRFG